MTIKSEFLTSIQDEVDARITPETDVYEVTTRHVVKKGVDIEQLLTDMVQGTYEPPNHNGAHVGMSFIDIVPVVKK